MGATPTQTVISRLEQAGKQPRQHGDRWQARCPAHDDNNPSLSIAPGTEPDQVLMHCHAGCTIEDITAAIGLEPKDLFAPKQRNTDLTEIEQYTYTDTDGAPVMRVHRFHPKTFRQSHWNGTSWQWGARNVTPTLYRLPNVIDAITNQHTIYIVEGERDVHTLEQLGHTATTNAGGAGKWRHEHTLQLAGATSVIIIADSDTPGHRHAEQIAAELNWAGIPHQIVTTAPGTKDISEHLCAGHTLQQLEPYTPTDIVDTVDTVDATSTLEHGWEPTDLTEILTGTYTPPTPTIGKRTDGTGLFYSSRINALFGESGSGKSWVAMATCAQEIRNGHNVIYIDHEDHAGSVTNRMIKLGCTPTQLLEQLTYIRPNRAWNQLAKADISELITTNTTLIVCDSTGEGMSLDGVDPNSDDGVARWMRDFGRHLADQGPALLLLDHMPKSSDANKAYMIGSQRKKAAIDGAAYRVDVNIAPAKGIKGFLNLVVAKDRGGYYQHGSRVADIAITDSDTGIDVIITPSVTGTPTNLMKQISDFLYQKPGASQNAVFTNITGRNAIVKEALEELIKLGYVEQVEVGNGTRNTNLRPFNEIELLQTPTTSSASDRVPSVRDTVDRPSTSTVSDRVPSMRDTVGSQPFQTVSQPYRGTRLETVKPAQNTPQETTTETEPPGHSSRRPDII